MTTLERVQIFITAGGIPKILDGQLRAVEDSVYTVAFSGAASDLSGQVVLNFPDSERERVMTRLDHHDGDVFQFVESHRVAPDKRNYPRLYAGLRVQYRAVGSSDWFQTDEYMNFSVSGLAFDGTGDVSGATGIELDIAMDEGQWRATGRVIRCDALSADEQVELPSGERTNYSLAVSFDTIPAACREALEALTLRLLDV